MLTLLAVVRSLQLRGLDTFRHDVLFLSLVEDAQLRALAAFCADVQRKFAHVGAPALPARRLRAGA